MLFMLQTSMSFTPSVGLEFITQMGVHLPDYGDAGIEMHTNMYHESSFKAKITMSRNQIKLSVPAPESSTQLLSVRSVAHLTHGVNSGLLLFCNSFYIFSLYLSEATSFCSSHLVKLR